MLLVPALLLCEIGFATLLDVAIGVNVLSDAAAQPRRRKRSRKVILEVSSLTEGAEVFVDGNFVGIVPLDGGIEVEPGEHVIKVSKRGYVDYLETHQLKRSRKPYVVEADLLPFSGVMIIQTVPTGAQVLIDDAFVGETPFEGEIEEGERKITLQTAGYLSHEEQRAIIAGETYFIDLSLTAEPPPVVEAPFWTTWWFWTGVAVVLAGGTAVAFALSGDGDPVVTEEPLDGPPIRLPLRVDF